MANEFTRLGGKSARQWQAGFLLISVTERFLLEYVWFLKCHGVKVKKAVCCGRLGSRKMCQMMNGRLAMIGICSIALVSCDYGKEESNKGDEVVTFRRYKISEEDLKNKLYPKEMIGPFGIGNPKTGELFHLAGLDSSYTSVAHMATGHLYLIAPNRFHEQLEGLIGISGKIVEEIQVEQDNQESLLERNLRR